MSVFKTTAAHAHAGDGSPFRAQAGGGSLAGVVRRINRLLTPAERRELLLLAAPVVLAALLEAAGVASIIPFLGLLSDPTAVERNAFLKGVYQFVGASSRERFFFVIGTGVLVTMTIANLVQALTTYALLRFSWMRNHTISVRLFESYLHRPYTFFVQNNTSDLAKNLLSEVQNVVNGVVVQGLQACARLFVCAFVGISLLFVDPVMAIGVTVAFGGLYGAIYMAARRTLTRLGFERVDANAARFKIASEILSGIKELKLLGLESTLLQSYAVPSEVFADRMAKNSIVGSIPRYALETVAFGGVLVITLYLLWSGKPLEGALPVLGLYAFAAYRLLPAVQVVFVGVTTVRFSLGALDTLARGIEEAIEERAPEVAAAAAQKSSSSSSSPSSRPAALAFERELALRDVTYRYQGAERDALAQVTLTIKRGEWVALVGPTGSGKTTLVDVVLGLLAPTSGDVAVDGAPIKDVRAWQRNVGYVPQQIFLTDDTVKSNIAFGIPAKDVDDAVVREAARIAQLAPFIEGELAGGYQAVVGERGVRISGGQRQRLGIARAIYRTPLVLVLDEATSALDGATEAAFLQALRAQLKDRTVISIAHRLSTTASFDRVVLIESGRVAAEGTPADAIAGRGPFAVVHAQVASAQGSLTR